MIISRNTLSLIGLAMIFGLSSCAATKPPASNPSSTQATSAQISTIEIAQIPIPKPDPQTVKAATNPTVDAATTERFNTWLKGFRKRAIAQGINADVFDIAVDGIAPNAKVIKATKVQPEFVRPVWEYIEKAVSDYRIQRGRELLIQHKPLFDQIEAHYGVQRQYLVAIWGMESAFGSFMGEIYVIEALATLAFEGRRTKFGEEQLIAALKILQNGYSTKNLLKGSWAGAMGQTQFIPTTYLSYAVDHNGDGKRDIWSDLGDVFASTSNYLVKSKWKRGQKWGQEVALPANFDYALAERDITKTVVQWQNLGVKAVTGQSLDLVKNETGSIIIPAGHKGPAFLIFNNFRSILRYNNATSYALGVGLLAESLVGGPKIVASWPLDEKPLNRADRKKVQTLLSQLGYQTGKADGIIGAQTRSAVRRYQKDKGLPADGFVTTGLLARLKNDNAG